MTQCTRFQKSVYNALLKIPKGKVTTYKILAAHFLPQADPPAAEKCRSYRAVGQALKRNPFAPRVPCHRVIASDLTPGGFQGKRTGAAIKRKLKLLEAEGVKFQNGHLTNPAVIYQFNHANKITQPDSLSPRAFYK